MDGRAGSHPDFSQRSVHVELMTPDPLVFGFVVLGLLLLALVGIVGLLLWPD